MTSPRRRMVAALAGALLLGGILTSYWLWPSTSSPPALSLPTSTEPTSPRELSLQAPTPTPEADALFASMTEGLRPRVNLDLFREPTPPQAAPWRLYHAHSVVLFGGRMTTQLTGSRQHAGQVACEADRDAEIASMHAHAAARKLEPTDTGWKGPQSVTMWFCLPSEDQTIGADDLWHDCHITKVAQAMIDPMTKGPRNFAAEMARGGMRSRELMFQDKCPSIREARQQALGTK